ncbi:MAG TPA: dihydrolipoamide acetyltransferase family protein [Ktedonobacterales bacterium]|jgi:pyruvate/2-oxoglutarate dehydrogenase complex dihydrolipoamide acyltransferase (E2) component|nr:dihydrolipoamide acetyltransferase family protein [Ktedonobacterales bacterium]
MPTKITMPQLGESVNEGTIGQWLKQEGETVKKDEALVEIITDKVTAELPSPASGVLVKILVQADETVKVGAEIAEIEEAGAATTPSVTPTTQANSQTAPQSSASSASSMNGGTNGGASTGGMSSGPNGATATATLTAPAQEGQARMERVSPLARRLAQEHHLDLNAIRGTGEAGRIRKEDIEAYLQQQSQTATATLPPAPVPVQTPPPQPTQSAPTMAATQASTPSAPPAAPPAPPAAPPVQVSGEDQIITPTPARRAIAEHMVRSKQTSPHAWTAIEVDMTNVARWLDSYKDEFKRREGFGVSFQTSVIKAAAEALKDHPYLNASWTDDGKIALRRQVNIGVSIALENNLIVPVIRNADTLNLAGIARAVNDLVTRARANRLMPVDLQGATFTVNNPGVFGTVLSAAIINQPNAAILTMDTVVKRAVVINDGIAIRSMMFLSLSFDHRVLDGLQAARFLAALKQRLETWSPDTSAY